MTAVVTITKSFKEGSVFRKEWEAGDFREFMEKEGGYIDNLCKVLEDKGEDGDDFEVTYEVKVRK